MFELIKMIRKFRLQIWKYHLIYIKKQILNMGSDVPKSSFQEGTHKVALLTGSLRKKSTNTGLLRAVTELNHPKFSFEWVDVWSLPVFNEDLEPDVPGSVQKARDLIYNSDAVLCGLPEYNFTISSPFKNAYDWLSRSYKDSPNNQVAPMQQKIAAMISSAIATGGAKSQQHFLDSIQFCKVKMMPTDESNQIKIKRLGGKFFDDDGNVIDDDLKKKLKNFMDCFDKWIQENKKK